MAGKANTRRPEQVAEAIRTVIAAALVRGEVRDPRVTLLTVSSVKVTRDLSVATINVVPHADNEPAREAAMVGLQSAAGYLRRIVAKELTTRIVPEIRFVRDRGHEHAQRINELLASVRTEEDPA
jgi:ribosome-binding factor A